MDTTRENVERAIKALPSTKHWEWCGPDAFTDKDAAALLLALVEEREHLSKLVTSQGVRIGGGEMSEYTFGNAQAMGFVGLDQINGPPVSISDSLPPCTIAIMQTGKELARIEKDGTVVVHELGGDVEAAKAFWKAMEDMGAPVFQRNRELEKAHAAALEKLKVAEEALRKHGAHTSDCDYLRLYPTDPPSRMPCSCGLDAAILALKGKP